MNLRELYEAGFSLGEVVIPKSNCYELFSSTYDDGSPLEMELRKGIRLKLEAKDYRGFRSQLDDERSKHECFIRHVYGVDDSFFGEGVNFVAS